MSEPLTGWFQDALKTSAFQERYSAYTHVLARLDPVADSTVPVMAVSVAGAHIRLHINSAFFASHPQYLRGVLLHEIHHIVLGHLTHLGFRGAVFPDLMELAMEASANEFICEPLPGEPVTWQAYGHLGLRAGQSTRERYELLTQARREGKLPVVALRLVDDHGSLICRAGPNGGGAASAAAVVEEILRGVESGDSEAGGKVTVLAGRKPGDLLTALRREAQTVAPFDWRAALATFSGRLRSRAWSYARPNRRFPERIGQVPGRLRTPDRPVLLAAIDTSGSMTDATLCEIAAQIERIAEHTDVIVAECDAVIQRTYHFRGRIDEVKGRGGTDLRPVFELDFLRSQDADAVVYFTDGVGPYPSQHPGIPTLWVLTGNAPFHCPWGRQVRLDQSSDYT